MQGIEFDATADTKENDAEQQFTTTSGIKNVSLAASCADTVPQIVANKTARVNDFDLSLIFVIKLSIIGNISDTRSSPLQLFSNGHQSVLSLFSMW